MDWIISTCNQENNIPADYSYQVSDFLVLWVWGYCVGCFQSSVRHALLKKPIHFKCQHKVGENQCQISF